MESILTFRPTLAGDNPDPEAIMELGTACVPDPPLLKMR